MAIYLLQKRSLIKPNLLYKIGSVCRCVLKTQMASLKALSSLGPTTASLNSWGHLTLVHSNICSLQHYKNYALKVLSSSK